MAGPPADIVLEESQSYFDEDTGLTLMSVQISRFHNDTTTTGALDQDTDRSLVDFAGSKIKGRAQITTMFYESDLNRPVATAVRGTNAESNYDRDSEGVSSVPTGTDTLLVSSRIYNDNGTVRDAIDPKGLVTRTLYDDAGRRIAEVRNYINGTPSSSTGDDDLYTRFTYTDGLMTEYWVDLDGDGTQDSDDQVTTYTFGVTKGTSAGQSALQSNSMLQSVAYPDSSSGSDVVSYAYNTLGQQTWMKDQSGNIIESNYDAAGRETARRATTVISGFDGAVKRISTAYDSRGMVDTITQYDNAAVGSGSATDQVQYSYDDWGNLAEFEQDVDSTISGGSGRAAFSVAYGYTKVDESGEWPGIRRTTLTLPGSYAVDYNYGADTGINDAVSRVEGLYIPAGMSEIQAAGYEYLGLGTVVGTELPEPGTEYNAYATTPTAYAHWDRFNRVIKSHWTGANRYTAEIAYDRNSNITSVDDARHSVTGKGLFDAAYTMDNLNRLTNAREGHLATGAIGTGDRTREELWTTLSQTGNWERRKLDLDGDGSYTGSGELDDTGTFNVANEWLTRDQDSNAGTTGNNFTLAHDAVGNMTDDGTRYEYEYDVWGRLRKVKRTDNQALVAEYRYNGLGYRISWLYDNDDSMGAGPDGSVDGSDKTYYFAHDERWRVVAVYRGSDSDPKERYLYHAAGLRGHGGSSYIDQVVMRDRDANSDWTAAADGTLEERRYYLQNWRADVSAIIDSTGDIVEWVKYSAYGVPYALIPGDYDRDGDVDSADQSAFISDWGAGSPSADLDESGGVDGDDLTVFGAWYTANTGKVGGRGVLSEESVGNRIGYAGYRWDPATSLNHVRHRVYNPEMGRWTRRDPIGYVDGVNLLRYSRGSPLESSDPSGLAWRVDTEITSFNAASLRNKNMGVETIFRFSRTGWPCPQGETAWIIQRVIVTSTEGGCVPFLPPAVVQRDYFEAWAVTPNSMSVLDNRWRVIPRGQDVNFRSLGKAAMFCSGQLSGDALPSGWSTTAVPQAHGLPAVLASQVTSTSLSILNPYYSLNPVVTTMVYADMRNCGDNCDGIYAYGLVTYNAIVSTVREVDSRPPQPCTPIVPPVFFWPIL